MTHICIYYLEKGLVHSKHYVKARYYITTQKKTEDDEEKEKIQGKTETTTGDRELGQIHGWHRPSGE